MVRFRHVSTVAIWLFTVTVALLLACDAQLFFYSTATMHSHYMRGHCKHYTLYSRTLRMYTLTTSAHLHSVFPSSPHAHFCPLTHSLCICTHHVRAHHVHTVYILTMYTLIMYTLCTYSPCTHSQCTHCVHTHYVHTHHVHIVYILTMYTLTMCTLTMYMCVCVCVCLSTLEKDLFGVTTPP